MNHDPFQTADRTVGRIAVWAGVLLLAAAGGVVIARGGMLVGMVLIGLPVVGLVVRVVAQRPEWGLDATLAAAFFGVGMRRYITAPTGLLVDAALAATLVLVLLRRPEQWDWSRLKNGLVAVVVIWFLYNVFELFNPERPSAAAWFYAVRGVSLYWLLAVPLALLVYRDRAHLDRVLLLWMAFSLLGTLWGLKQLFIGLDGGEAAWLAEPGNRTTHLLFGKLRVFSFYSDSGQFGAAQGHTAVLAGILALGPGPRWKRLLLAAVAALSLWGLLISGTRGAMAVPFVGFVVYLVLSRNWKILSFGVVAIVLVFGLLKYTFILHNVYEVRRMRTAIVEGADNPSLQVRLQNQKKLAAYLEGRPFGGGVGSAGYWGQRFSPGTFLADLALDSWYVKIWAEQGILGLWLYLAMLLYISVAGLRRVLRARDPTLRQQLAALFAGFLGIAAASYGNQVLGQVPTGIVIPFGLAFLFLSDRFDTPDPATEPDPSAPARQVADRAPGSDVRGSGS